jgi:hypothetical protein
MYCDEVRDMLLSKDFVFKEKQIPYGASFKFLGGLILMVFNGGSVVFRGKCDKNESLMKKLQSLLHI